MFKRTTLSALILATGLISAQANAAFVETDWKAQGDGLATLDTDTGIEWLDVSETYNLTLEQINSRLSADLSGWRYATFDEVVNMVSSFFGSPSSSWVSQTMPSLDSTAEERNLWRSLFGTSTIGDGAWDGISLGAVRKDAANDALWSLFGAYRYGNDVTYVVPVTGNSYSYSAQNGFSGYFIVSDGGTTLSSINNPNLNINNPNAPVNQAPDATADVPVHAGFGLLGLVLMAFGLRRRNSA